MYLVPIAVPVFITPAGRHGVSSDWAKALRLLRDSFQGRFGQLHVVCPWLAAEDCAQLLETADWEAEDIKFHPVFHARTRTRAYWLRGGRRQWMDTIRSLLPRAQVVHCGINELFRPYCYEAFLAALRAGKPTVFVRDVDENVRLGEKAALQRHPRRALTLLHRAVFDRCVRYAVRRADLTLVKSGTLQQTYGPIARNLGVVEDTSYLSHEIPDESRIHARTSALMAGRPLHLVFCGRVVESKGVDLSIRAVIEAQRQKAAVRLDIIGDGSHLATCEQAALAAAPGTVRFLGAQQYGPDLLERLASYDGLLFTSRAEETPRMIFDGYAAGLPLLAWPIPYVAERLRSDRAGIELPRDDVAATGRRLAELAKSPGELVAAAENAIAAGREYAADVLYARRAAWTIEAARRRGVFGIEPEPTLPVESVATAPSRVQPVLAVV